MNRTVSVLLVAAAAVSLSACAPRQDPCLRLSPPTPQELAVVAAGAEVEREFEVNGYDVECDLVDGRWTEEVNSEG